MVTTEDLVRRSPSVGRDRTPHHTPPRRLHGAPDRQSALGPTDVQMAQSGTSSFTARAKRAGGSDNARQRWSRRLVAGAFAFAAWAVPADQMRDWISPQRERSVAPTAVINAPLFYGTSPFPATMDGRNIKEIKHQKNNKGHKKQKNQKQSHIK